MVFLYLILYIYIRSRGYRGRPTVATDLKMHSFLIFVLKKSIVYADKFVSLSPKFKLDEYELQFIERKKRYCFWCIE